MEKNHKSAFGPAHKLKNTDIYTNVSLCVSHARASCPEGLHPPYLEPVLQTKVWKGFW